MFKDKSSRVIKLQGQATLKNRMTVKQHNSSLLLSSTLKFPFPFAFHSINHSKGSNWQQCTVTHTQDHPVIKEQYSVPED